MLDDSLKAQLAAYLEHLKGPVELVARLDDSPAALEMRQLLEEICEVNSRISSRRLRADVYVTRPAPGRLAASGSRCWRSRTPFPVSRCARAWTS